MKIAKHVLEIPFNVVLSQLAISEIQWRTDAHLVININNIKLCYHWRRNDPSKLKVSRIATVLIVE